MTRLARRLRRSLLAWLGKLLAIRDTPEAMARGLAVGFFFGVSFLWGLQILLAVAVAHLLRGNKMIAAALTAVSNPLTTLPLYSLCYWLGQLVLGGDGRMPDFAQVTSLSELLALGPRFFLAMLVGTTLVGLVGALLLYSSASRIFTALRRWHGRHRKPLPGAPTGREVSAGEAAGREVARARNPRLLPSLRKTQRVGTARQWQSGLTARCLTPGCPCSIPKGAETQ